MTEAAEAMPALTAEQLDEIVRLLPGSDSVELKLTVSDDNRQSVVNSLGIDVMKAEIRQVAYFDTPDLTLNTHGLVLRARRIQDKPGDSVVKLRPVVPANLTASVRSLPGFGVEVDAMPGGFVCSARMKAPVKDKAVHRVLRGEKPVRSLFTAPQQAMFEKYAPAGVSIEDLVVLGPLSILKLKFSPKGYPRKIVAELWFYPDGSRILELSTKCLPAETFPAAAEARTFLASRDVDLSAPQQTKTRTALELLAPRTS